jgi:hypothetical protein
VSCRSNPRGDEVEGYWLFPDDDSKQRVTATTPFRPSRLQRRHVPVRAVCPNGFTRRLSALPDSSHGVHSKIALPLTSPMRLPPGRTGVQPSTRVCQHSSAVRPCRFSRLRRLSAHQLAGLLRPAASRRVRQVSGDRRTVAFPTDAHPSKLFPRRQPKTRHRASCPPAVVRVVR